MVRSSPKQIPTKNLTRSHFYSFLVISLIKMSFILFGIQLLAIETMPMETVWTASTLDPPPSGRYQSKSVEDDAFILIEDAVLALSNRSLWSEIANPNAFMQPVRSAGYSDATQRSGLTASIEDPASMLLADELLAGDQQPRTIDGENQNSLASLQDDSHHQREKTEALVVVDENYSTGASTDLDLYFKPIPTSEYDEFWTLATVPFISHAATVGNSTTLYKSDFNDGEEATLHTGMDARAVNTVGEYQLVGGVDSDSYLALSFQDTTNHFGYGVVESDASLKFSDYHRYIFKIESSFVVSGTDSGNYQIEWIVTAGTDDDSLVSQTKRLDPSTGTNFTTLTFTFENLSDNLNGESIYFRFEPKLDGTVAESQFGDFKVNLTFAELQAVPEMSSFSFISGLVVLFLVMTRRSRYLAHVTEPQPKHIVS